MKRYALASAVVVLLAGACGTEGTSGETDPGPAQVEDSPADDTGGGGTMDDQDLDY